MTELTTRQHFTRILIVVVVGAIMACGIVFLPPADYQPSRPIYAACCLVACFAAYLALRRAHPVLSSAALRLSWVFAEVFAVALFM
jgi:hypothetical protein